MKSSVAVVGGGLVGVTAALRLADLGFPTTLYDRARPEVQRGKLGIDIRNVALSPASQALLADTGAWDKVDPLAYRRMVVWEEWGTSEIVFTAEDLGAVQMGWIAENSPLVVALWACFEAKAQAAVCLGTIDELCATDEGVTLTMLDGATHEHDFLIGADGARSMVREALGVRCHEQPTGHVAIASVVETAAAHEHTAWQRFLLDGPCALLPGADPHVCSIVWSQSAAQAERRMALDDGAFCRELTVAMEARLGDVVAVDRRIAFPLVQQRASACQAHARALLVGDALRVVHPLAGFGVNLGLEDVARLVEIAQNVEDLAGPGLWRRYAAQRLARSSAMINTMAALQTVYASPSPAMALLRNVGVRSLNAVDMAKRQIMREAMGLGPLARL